MRDGTIGIIRRTATISFVFSESTPSLQMSYYDPAMLSVAKVETRHSGEVTTGDPPFAADGSLTTEGVTYRSPHCA